jgi:hypothetical protein
VKKAFGSSIDCWRQELNALSGMRSVNIDPDLMDSNVNPMLKEICSSFYDFKRNYNLMNDNFFNSCLLGNPNLVNEKRFALPVGNKFWSDKLNNPHGELDNIRICDLFTDQGRVKNIHQMGNTLMSNLDRDTYNAIKKVLETSM